jgi:uncharacterized membrane protein YfcA
MNFAVTFAVIFVAASLQSLAGFGFALIVMPVLTLVLGLRTAAPTVALIALTLYLVNVLRYRHSIDIREVSRLGLASAIGVPIGVWVLSNLDENLVKQVMGVSLVVYGLYSFIRPTVSRRLGSFWVYPTGFLTGCLAGAYNFPGPPVIVYGSLRQWPRDRFRAILQAIFLVNGFFVVASHFLAHNVTSQVLTYGLYAVPALLLGVLVSSLADQRVNRDAFRIVMQAMILVIGLVLFAGAA